MKSDENKCIIYGWGGGAVVGEGREGGGVSSGRLKPQYRTILDMGGADTDSY